MSTNTPLHAQLYSEMLSRIEGGDWQTGDRVPSEKSLIEEFGTSRGPVRQALAALRADGLIAGGRGAPPRVQYTAPSQSFDVFMSFTEWARDLGLEPGQLSVEMSRHPASEEIAGELRVSPDAPVVTVTRLRLLDDQPTMVERSTFPYEIGKHLLPAGVDNGSLYQALRSHGIVPVRARHVIDAVGADVLEAKYLGVDVGTPLLRVRRVSYSENGAVIESADDRYLPSAASFVIENSATHRTPLARAAASIPFP